MNSESINIGIMPKLFCQNVMIVTSSDSFFMVVDTGNAKTVFALSPEHMKMLGKSITYNVEEYEKKFRKVDANWEPGVQSPIQATELKKK